MSSADSVGMNVELRLRGTFIDFRMESSQAVNNRRSASVPPYVHPQFGPEDDVDDKQLEYLEGLVNRASHLKLKKPDTSWGWTCVCGVASDCTALFCWNCGQSKEVACKKWETSVWRQFRRHSTTPLHEYSGTVKKMAEDRLSSLHNFPVCSVSTTDGGSSQYSLRTSSEKDFEELGCDDSGVSENDVGLVDASLKPITTLMISALPVRLTIDQLLASINSVGFLGTYDLVYMPYRSVKKRGKVQHGSPGYAFVNFKSPELASQFAASFEGFSFADINSERTAVVKPATSQGYHANLALHVREKKQHGSVITFP